MNYLIDKKWSGGRKKMKKVINWIKKKGKMIAGIGTVAALLSMAIFPTFSADALNPQFNFMDQDLEFLRGANTSRGETVWKDPVNGDAGDVIEVIAYYHNGRPETTAENTKLKVNIPSETTDNSATITASLWADNAPEITDTVIGGNINGLSGLTINLNEDATLELIPGSVQWYPNRALEPSALPFGQSGNEILSASGLNLGDICGCWPYRGSVIFAVQTTLLEIPTEPAHMVLNKVVRNISDNQSTFVETVDADQNEIVEYQIEVKNTGGEAQFGVNLKDVLPQKLSYVDGSATVTRNGVTSVVSANDLFSVGIDLGTLEPGEENKIIVTFRATAPAQIYSPEVLVNHATLVCGLDDTANVNLNPGNVTILKSKSAYNENESRDATEVAAESNDTIVYTLRTTNTGTLGTDVVVEDGIADVLEYANFISASDGGELVDGPAGTNEAKIVRYPSTILNPGVTMERTFTVEVKNPLPEATFDGFHFDDRMYNKYGNEILIDILRPTPVVYAPDLVIDKVVRNVTSDQAAYVDANTAQAGDNLEYMITLENVGEGKADQIKVYDLLPVNVAYDNSFTPQIIIDGVVQDLIGSITDGVIIDKLEAGESIRIIFKAKTSVDLASGEHLVNTAYAEDNGENISDTAETVIDQKVVVIETPEKVIIKTLPKTGAATAVIAALASLVIGLNFIYLKKKKELKIAKSVFQA